jgi:phosphoribosyl 1,2-cyclic phosphate phosphodiesterase
MEITFLGTGTSHGVPEIGCDCETCRSTNPKNKRTRCSILVEDGPENHLLVDASADFRQQALRENIRQLSDILITHDHADHIFGLDDTRIFCRQAEGGIALYANEQSDRRIRQIYEYVYKKGVQEGGGLPKFKNTIIAPEQTFSLGNFTITPLEIFHGRIPILGYRINNFAYLTDCSFIPEETYPYLQGLEVLVLDALRKEHHPTHFSLEEAIHEAHKIGAKQTFFTHITHHLEHESINVELPPTMQLAYDGQKIYIP